jgi:hypothetical protein
MTRAFVSLRLMSGTKSPEQLFTELGVPADKIWHKGDRRGRTSLIEQENGYEFTSADENISLEEQVGALTDRLAPIVDTIRRSGCEHVQLTCALYATTMPPIHFPASVVDTLGRLGASIDIDLYVAEANWME